jgi:hypothetical protein
MPQRQDNYEVVEEIICRCTGRGTGQGVTSEIADDFVATMLFARGWRGWTLSLVGGVGILIGSVITAFVIQRLGLRL